MGIMDTIKAAMATIQGLASFDERKSLLDLVTDAQELQAKNRILEEEICELRKALEFEGTLKFERNVYLSGDDPDPFCTGCWDGGKKAVRLTRSGSNYDLYRCSVCGKTFRTDGPGPDPRQIEPDG